MSGLVGGLFSLAMLAAFVLVGFGIKFALCTEYRKNGWLMIVAGVVILANVLIWAL